MLKLYKNKDIKEKLGQNGRHYVIKNYSREGITRKLENILLKLKNT